MLQSLYFTFATGEEPVVSFLAKQIASGFIMAISNALVQINEATVRHGLFCMLPVVRFSYARRTDKQYDHSLHPERARQLIGLRIKTG